MVMYSKILMHLFNLSESAICAGNHLCLAFIDIEYCYHSVETQPIIL